MEPSLDFFVRRTVRLGSKTTVELCVTRAIAEEWNPQWRDRKAQRRDKKLLADSADKRAYNLVLAALRAGRLPAGKWRATFPGGDRVEFAER